ncbi:MAG: twitching motility protein PilT [Lachnospiraceae bacterium]|nr:twitching motility protein PilT [Lachnospiraceae bacterium]
MVQLIVGEKGKGKTKVFLEEVNKTAASAKGSVVFVDKDLSHMFEVKNSVRFVNISEYGITNTDQFEGFIAGIISGDHDLEDLYVDQFMKSAYLDSVGQAEELVRRLDKLGNKFNVKITVSLTCNKEDLPEDIKEKVFIAL